MIERPMKGVETETIAYDCAEVTRIKITTAEASAKVGHPIGETATIQSDYFREGFVAAHMAISVILAEELQRFITIGDRDLVLVVGLGNPQEPSDALGSRTVEKVIKVNSIVHFATPNSDKNEIRPVSTFIPGVMAETGVATADVVKAFCDRVKPALVILVDSLCTLNIERLNTTIQIANSGISPGAAVAMTDKRAISAELLGVPVITVGAPVVIDAVALARDITTLALPVKGDDLADSQSLGAFFEKAAKRKGEKKARSARRVVLEDYEFEHVAPTGVVSVVGYFADIISGGINLALHKELEVANLRRSVN